MKSDIKSPYATLKEAAGYVRCSYSHALKVWPVWKEKYGVRVSKVGRSMVMPYKDLDSLIQQMEIV